MRKVILTPMSAERGTRFCIFASRLWAVFITNVNGMHASIHQLEKDLSRFHRGDYFPRSPFEEEYEQSKNQMSPSPEDDEEGDEKLAVTTSRLTGIMVLTAQVVSHLYSPFYLPVVAFIALFTLSYLNLLPWQTKLILTLMVYILTVLLPYVGIRLYRRLNGWTRRQMGRRERRFVPYLICMCSYALLLYFLYNLHMPRFTLGVVVGALLIQVVCTFLNSRIKVSMHAAASGGVIGALLAFSLIFSFDPTSWLCLAILLCGMVCTARLILRQHTLAETGWGVLVGVLCGFAGILFI